MESSEDEDVFSPSEEEEGDGSMDDVEITAETDTEVKEKSAEETKMWKSHFADPAKMREYLLEGLNEGKEVRRLSPFVNSLATIAAVKDDAEKVSILHGVCCRWVKVTWKVKIFQCDFPDTAEFGGSILDASTPVTETTETYARLALLLFCPFRNLSGLLCQGSYTLKFRQAVSVGVIHDEKPLGI